MAIISSLLFGTEGQYKVMGVQVHFHRTDLNEDLRADTGNAISQLFADSLSCLVGNLIQSQAFATLTLGRFHIFCHEMGHALVGKLVTGEYPEVEVYTNISAGVTSGAIPNGAFEVTIRALAGPLSGMFFSGCKLVAAAASAPTLTAPVAIFFATGSLFWMTGELIYAFQNIAFGSSGDFSNISMFGGNLALFLSLAALIGSYAFFLHTALLFLP